MNVKLLKQILGGVLLIIGLAALFTPLTPGAWLIFVGAELIGVRLLLSGRLLRYYEQLRERFWKKREGGEIEK